MGQQVTGGLLGHDEADVARLLLRAASGGTMIAHGVPNRAVIARRPPPACIRRRVLLF